MQLISDELSTSASIAPKAQPLDRADEPPCSTRRSSAARRRVFGDHATFVLTKDHASVGNDMAFTHSCVTYGASIVVYDRQRDDREAITRELARKSGATIIASSEHPDVIAGQGTVAKELIDEVGPLDYLFVPVGGGGLLAGSAIAAARWSAGCTLVGVEPAYFAKTGQ